jgi:hypothetical protein
MVEILTSSVDVLSAAGNKDLSINSRIFRNVATTDIGTVEQNKSIINIFILKINVNITRQISQQHPSCTVDHLIIWRSINCYLPKLNTERENKWHAAPSNKLMIQK